MPPKKAQTSAKASPPKKGKSVASIGPAAATKASRKQTPSTKRAQDTAEIEAETGKHSSPTKKPTSTQPTRKSSAKSPSPAKTSSTMPASKKAPAARSGSKRPAPDDEAVYPPKRGPGRPKRDATPIDEDEVMESIEEPARARGRPPVNRSRSQSPAKKLVPVPPRQRSVSQGRRTPSIADAEKLTPSRDPKYKRMAEARTGLTSKMDRSRISKQQQRDIQTLEGEDDSDTPRVGHSSIVEAPEYDDYNEPAPGRAGTPRARARGKQASQSTSAPVGRRQRTGSPAKPNAGSPEKKKEGHGNVTSFTNPKNIPNDDHTTDYYDDKGRGPFKNPFYEPMPLKETWYRNMPPMFPFGETPYFEQKMSDQINADLSRSHQETLDAQKKQKGSGSLLSSIGGGISSGLAKLTGGPASSPTKSPKKKSTAQVPVKRFTPWDLPEVDESVAAGFGQGKGIAV